MRWRRGPRSENLRDQRGGGMGMGTKAAGAIGLPGLLIALLALFLSRGGEGAGLEVPGLEGLPQIGAQQGGPIPREADPDADLVDFVSFVLDDVQGAWQQMFQQAGREYNEAELVLFTAAVRSGCGQASAQVGPFYCPLDRTAYVDLGFFRELRSRFGAPGDFAQAYVLAHEIAHHVQNELGVFDRVQRAQRENPDEANELSIRTELMADCLAGVWGYTAAQRGILEPGDVQEGIGAAEAVGDDRIQEQATGTISPESWTHGSSDQRADWFNRGLRGGNPDDCDTFR